MDNDLFNPDQILPFQSYRRLDEAHRLHDLSPSLSHFYESEKFRGVNEALRQEVLSCLTPRAARKVTKRNVAHWRADWSKVRGRVFRAGLIMQMPQSVEALSMARDCYARALEMAAIKRIGGLPGPFVAQQVSAAFEGLENKQTAKLGVLALTGYVPADLHSRLDAVYQQDLPFSAAIYVGEDADTAAERWCMMHAMPLRYVGNPSQRLRSAEHKAVTQKVKTLLVCAPATRKEVKEVAGIAKKSRVQILNLTALREAVR